MTKIAFGGDVHGHTGQIKRHLELASQAGATRYFQLGDWNLDNDPTFDRKVEGLSDLYDIQVDWLDGNHDNFPRIAQINPDNKKEFIKITDHVRYMPRNLQFELGGIKFHVIGGAHSIDEKYRILGRDLFAEEDITQEDVDYALTLPQADVILSHDCPSTVANPITSDFHGQLEAIRYFGADTLDKCKQNQDRLAEIANHINPSVIFHGHYHIRYDKYSVNPVTGDRFLTIGMHEGSRSHAPDSLYIIDTDDLHKLVKDIR